MAEKHQVIVVVVNEGFSDLVMSVARDNGARGGTIIHGRGTGTKEMEKKYGIIITPQKEIVYILVKNDISDKLMSEINKVVGIDTKGQGIVFALPVDNVVGLKFD